MSLSSVGARLLGSIESGGGGMQAEADDNAKSKKSKVGGMARNTTDGVVAVVKAWPSRIPLDTSHDVT